MNGRLTQLVIGLDWQNGMVPSPPAPVHAAALVRPIFWLKYSSNVKQSTALMIGSMYACSGAFCGPSTHTFTPGNIFLISLIVFNVPADHVAALMDGLSTLFGRPGCTRPGCP